MLTDAEVSTAHFYIPGTDVQIAGPRTIIDAVIVERYLSYACEGILAYIHDPYLV